MGTCVSVGGAIGAGIGMLGGPVGIAVGGTVGSAIGGVVGIAATLFGK